MKDDLASTRESRLILRLLSPACLSLSSLRLRRDPFVVIPIELIEGKLFMSYIISIRSFLTRG